MKKIYLFSLLALTGVFALSSCGDDTKTDDNPSGDSGSSGSNPGGNAGGEESGGGSQGGGAAQDVNEVKVYAVAKNTSPIYLATYSTNSKLQSFAYVDGHDTNVCKVVYNNDVPERVKVCSFNNFFGVNTNQVALNGNNPIYYTDISNNMYYPIPAYSYASYSDNAINVKSAGADIYKIKLNGDVESTLFKKVDSNGLKIGIYNNKLENNKLVATSYDGKAEMTFDGSKIVSESFMSLGDKYLSISKVTFEVTDTFAENKITRSLSHYGKAIDYSSIKGTIDSNYNTTAVEYKAYTKNLSSAGNSYLLETPEVTTRTCTSLDNNQYKIAYTENSVPTEIILTYDSGKIKKCEATGAQQRTIDYDYQNNNEVKVEYTDTSESQHFKYEIKHNFIGQRTEEKYYSNGETLSSTTTMLYNDNHSIAKSTTIANNGNYKTEAVYTYNDAFTERTSVYSQYNGETMQANRKEVSKLTPNALEYISYIYSSGIEKLVNSRKQSFENGVETTTDKAYNSAGEVYQTMTTTRTYNDSLVVTKVEALDGETLLYKDEFTYDNSGKLVTRVYTTATSVKTYEYTFENDILKTCTVTTVSLEDQNDKTKSVYTYSNNYATVNTQDYKWDTGTGDYIQANLA